MACEQINLYCNHHLFVDEIDCDDFIYFCHHATNIKIVYNIIVDMSQLIGIIFLVFMVALAFSRGF